MTQDDAYDSTITDSIDDLEAVDTEKPVETAVSIATGDELPESLPLVGGAVVLLAAVRSLRRGQRRSIPLALGGAWLVRYGLRKRRSSEVDGSTFEPETESDEDSDGDDQSADSRIEFADDDKLEQDPRQDDDDDVDLSASATADEAGEATGPDPEQAQPAQTDVTEPQATPSEDASDKKVEPDSDADEGEADDSNIDDETETE